MRQAAASNKPGPRRRSWAGAVLATNVAVLAAGCGLVLAGPARATRLAGTTPGATGTAPGLARTVPVPRAGRPASSPPANRVTAPAADRSSQQPATTAAALRAAAVADSAATAASPVPGRVQPTVLVVAPNAVPAPAVAVVAHRVPAVSVLTSGTVLLAGRPAAVLGVQPASFRAFTPAPTQASDALWEAVGRGEAAVSFGLARSRHLRLGQSVQLGGRRVRIGAEADFGLSQAAVVVDPTLARALGLGTEELLLGHLDANSAASTVAPLLGGGQVINLVPAAPPAPAATANRPTSWQQLYIGAAATCPGLPWNVLAAIGQIESDQGRNVGPSSAGALGPMQFLPATFAEYGYDPFGRGRPNIEDPIDSVYSAARLLCSDGGGAGPAGLRSAVFAYNHSTTYVDDVLGLAAAYGRRYG